MGTALSTSAGDGPRARLNRDMDYGASSNILILLSGGGFHFFFSALQRAAAAGRGLVIMPYEMNGLICNRQGMYCMDPAGRVNCTRDFTLVAARILAPYASEASPPEAVLAGIQQSSEMLQRT